MAGIRLGPKGSDLAERTCRAGLSRGSGGGARPGLGHAAVGPGIHRGRLHGPLRRRAAQGGRRERVTGVPALAEVWA